mmetsp:Transcript_75718/g.201248  ORF Transcript_75718/g.201248 Transcript_75718/m.201248 type:complete len:231 (+) Transcript_75718:34-726(+)
MKLARVASAITLSLGAASAITLPRAPLASVALSSSLYGLRSVRPCMMCTDASPPAEAVAEAAGPTPFEELDVRVGKIIEAWEHPDSEKLWCERIDVGEDEPREIASGLRAYYATAEELAGRSVLVVCNLKPAKLGGFPSNGMVLCASSKDRGTVAFVEPPEGSAPGDRVLCEGAVAVAPASANRVKKKKLMELAAEELKAVDTIATYKGVPLCTEAGPCKSPTVEEGTIN